MLGTICQPGKVPGPLHRRVIGLIHSTFLKPQPLIFVARRPDQQHGKCAVERQVADQFDPVEDRQRKVEWQPGDHDDGPREQAEQDAETTKSSTEPAHNTKSSSDMGMPRAGVKFSGCSLRNPIARGRFASFSVNATVTGAMPMQTRKTG